MSGKGRTVMQKDDRWREQVPIYRFWNNEKVTEEALAGCMEDHCREQCAGLGEAGSVRHRSRLKRRKVTGGRNGR
jgi:hypothetical protein